VSPTAGGTNTVQKYQPFPSGAAQAPYGLSVTTATPDLSQRGVAANAAGTTQWVVDANLNVYVYSPGGTLLGSWAATGMPSGAQVAGIATNSTDIWLLDPPAAKVYKYTGAASRRSGSQSAASSFNLVSGKNGNTNPTGMVTDGASFWVVDGTKLKVFKYSLSGSSLGNWAIDPADTHPTGITVNPNNVSDVWIVDSGTLKVYDYTAAAGRTSGSQSAASTFALAPGDTNPVGIADPPTADLFLTSAAAPPPGSRWSRRPRAPHRPECRPGWLALAPWLAVTRCSPCWVGSRPQGEASPRPISGPAGPSRPTRWPSLRRGPGVETRRRLRWTGASGPLDLDSREQSRFRLAPTPRAQRLRLRCPAGFTPRRCQRRLLR
jgi:hypothetical protein